MISRSPLLIPRVIGHRGAAALAPENTLAGFRKAAALGCRWVEFDVRLTGDGEAVLFHDDTVARLTQGRGAVSSLSLAELKALRIRGEAMPTLGEALEELRALDLGGNLELKAEPGREAALAETVARIVAAAAAPPLLVSSFSLVALDAFGRAAPALPRGVLFEAIPPDARNIAARLGAVAIVGDHRHLRPFKVREVKATGLLLLAYTVNDPRRARDLLAWGVDSVITDRPDVMLTALPPSPEPEG
jgi:glycerophosphoryl diester phosphodiesterase